MAYTSQGAADCLQAVLQMTRDVALALSYDSLLENTSSRSSKRYTHLAGYLPLLTLSTAVHETIHTESPMCAT